MGIQRSTLKTGPAIVLTGDASIYFKDGLTITKTIATFDITVDGFGVADKRVQDRSATITGTPAGAWKNLEVLWPWLNVPIGTRLFGDADTPLVVHGFDGTVYTFHNVAVTKMPGIRAAATETLIGDCEWTARIKDGADPEDEDSLFTNSSEPFDDDTFDVSEIKTLRYAASWGPAPWDNFHTVDGFTLDFPMQTIDITVDGAGVVDQQLSDVQATASFRPLGVPQDALDAKLAMQGADTAVQGSSLAARGANLDIAGDGVFIRLYGAAATSMEQSFSMSELRNGQMQAIATRSGNAAPLAYVGTEAPAA